MLKPNQAPPASQPLTESRRADHELDYHLVRRVLKRERKAMDEFIHRLARVPAVVRAKNKRMGGILTREEEIDAAQDAMAALWAKLATFQGRSTLDTWVYGFAVTQVLKAVQTKRRLRLKDETSALDDLASGEERDNSGLDPRELHEALERLEPGNADVVRLRHFEELPFETIATRMKVKLNTVKARYYRSLSRLEEDLAARWEASKS